MATDFSSLKKSSGSNIQKLSEQLEKMNTNSTSYVDDRIWSVVPDKAGNYNGIIRFLPAPKGEDNPFVRKWNHGFQNAQGRWFIHDCPTTIGKQCPVCEANSILWNSGNEEDKKLVSGQNGRKRKLSYYANILVIKDPNNKDNEGKVFLFRYGKQIHEKIQQMLKPEYDDESPVDIFDFWNGANFHIRCRKNEGGYPTYVDSKFSDPSELMNGDDQLLEKIWNSEHSLEEFISPDNFLPYDEMKEKLEEFLGMTGSPQVKAEDVTLESMKQKPAPSIKQKAAIEDDELPPFNTMVEDEEDEELDSLSRFRKLVNDD